MSRAPVVPVIGGGPAGMSCALWLANYGLRPVIVERAAGLGGMPRRDPHRSERRRGRRGNRGGETAPASARHVHAAGIEVVLGSELRQLRSAGDGTVTLALAGPAARELSGRALVIATGTRFR